MSIGNFIGGTCLAILAGLVILAAVAFPILRWMDRRLTAEALAQAETERRWRESVEHIAASSPECRQAMDQLARIRAQLTDSKGN